MYAETTATIVLSAWERAYGLDPVERGLALLSLAKPQESLNALGHWTIGRRDAELLRLRRQLFGEDLHSLDICPECGEKIEVSFAVRDILIPDRQSADSCHQSRESMRLEIDGLDLTLRGVTTADLLTVRQVADQEARRDALLSRCVSAGCPPVSAMESPDPTPEFPLRVQLSQPALQTVNAKLIEIDPQADIRIAMDCTRCDHHWSSRFDIARFLWAEIDAWAQRLLAEVHALAFAYGWSERDILTMSSWRRHLYLGMLRR